MSGKQKTEKFKLRNTDINNNKKYNDYGKFNECKRLCWNLW